MKPKLITCNYTDLYGTKLNGRLNRDEVYKFSLGAIARTKANIVCYTGDYNYNFMQEYLTSREIENVKQVLHPLTASQYYDIDMAIKDVKPQYYTENSWLNRCPIIMFSKFSPWMEENLKDLDDEDYLFWIDAGLSAGNLIPRKFNPFYKNTSPEYWLDHKPDELKLEYSFRNDEIYNEKFISRLEAMTGDKILLITCKHQQHNDEMGIDLPHGVNEFPIGGLFGGKKKHLIVFINKFKETLKVILDKQLLVKEEQIMTYILATNKELFTTFPFETWYHEDWDFFKDLNMISFSTFFDKLLEY